MQPEKIPEPKVTLKRESIDDGGPAFPVLPPLEGGMIPPGFPYSSGGMTLRDYFAAKAMAGMCASYADIVRFLRDTGNGETPPFRAIAILAYEQADQMLNARAQ